MRFSFCNISSSAALLSALAMTLGATSVALPGAVYAQAIGDGSSADIQVTGHWIPPMVAARQIEGVVIDRVVNVIGFEGAKRDAGGRFTFDGNAVNFITSNATYSIPSAALRSFTIEHSNKGLMRGTKGVMASFAPQGVGQLYSVFRPGAETLTLTYVDENQGLHGAVLILPKTRKDDVLRAFADAGLRPAGAPIADAPDPEHVANQHDALTRPIGSDGPRSVEISLPVASVQGVPAAYIAGTYEEMITQIRKGGSFETVYRQGDHRADGDALRLNTNITQLKKGNAGIRGAIPVVGMIVGKTQIEAEVRLTDADGTLLFKKDMKGSKRMVGENIAAAKSLAQRVSKALSQDVVATDLHEGSRVASK